MYFVRRHGTTPKCPSFGDWVIARVAPYIHPEAVSNTIRFAIKQGVDREIRDRGHG